jgi:hypothetical protein
MFLGLAFGYSCFFPHSLYAASKKEEEICLTKNGAFEQAVFGELGWRILACFLPSGMNCSSEELLAAAMRELLLQHLLY